MDLIDKRDEVLRLFLEYGITENTENDLTKKDIAECAEQIVKKLIIGGVMHTLTEYEKFASGLNYYGNKELIDRQIKEFIEVNCA